MNLEGIAKQVISIVRERSSITAHELHCYVGGSRRRLYDVFHVLEAARLIKCQKQGRTSLISWNDEPDEDTMLSIYANKLVLRGDVWSVSIRNYDVVIEMMEESVIMLEAVLE